ncbi:MAG: type II toxin-antitoxin system RelE/ParE family toxin [Acidimicrobiales bacterium]
MGAGQGRSRPGMTYQVVLSPSATRQLRKFDPDARRRIQAVLELVAENPRPPAATRLVGGAGEWRVRTGDYRVIYEIHERQLLVLVLRMGHRREVYER